MKLTFGEQIKEVRIQQRWRVGELADAAGVHRTLLWRIEQGQDTKLSNAIRIAHALGMVIVLKEATNE